jgi:hypothetical protein
METTTRPINVVTAAYLGWMLDAFAVRRCREAVLGPRPAP